MPWVVGIDEAGYGPNLGPLVQAAAELWVSPEDLAGWVSYVRCVRRCGEPEDARLLIDDSKKVHQGPNKLARLERTVMPLKNASIVMPEEPRTMSFQRFLSLWSCKPHEEVSDVGLGREPWYDPDFSLPAEWDTTDHEACLGSICGFAWIHGTFAVNHRFTTAAEVNRCITATGTKATATANGLISLMRDAVKCGYIGLSDSRDSPVIIYCDKQGGRHYYAPLLQEAFPAGWVVAEREGPAESRYRVMNLDRDVTVIFRPKADADSISVALASMTAKYLREICMRQFNAFWAKHVPGLKPTAGYPLDAKRFFKEIEPAMQALGIPKDVVWRNR